MITLFKISFLSFFLMLSFTLAQEMSLSVEAQYPLLLKILTYDKNISGRLKNDLSILIIYQSNFRKSRSAKDEIANVIGNSNLKIENKKVIAYFYDFNDENELSQFIKENKIDLLYITPLRSVNLSRIVQLTENDKVISFSAIPEYMEKGVTLGLDVKDEKPLILINLEAAKKVGCEFQSQLLKFSKLF